MAQLVIGVGAGQFLPVAVPAAPGGGGGAPPGEEAAEYFTHTHQGRIPNFVYPALIDIRADTTGDWSDTNTWSGGVVPTATDVVSINPGVTVTVDVDDAEAKTVGIQATGKLAFATDADTRLTVQHLQVLDGGTLEIGTEGDPIQAGSLAEVVFRDAALETGGSPPRDPHQLGNGLLVLGNIACYGADKTPFKRLAGTVSAGASTLTTAAGGVTGWRSGDKIALPSNKFYYHIDLGESSSTTTHHETHELDADATGGATSLSLLGTVTNARGVATDKDGTQVAAVHAANLSRNVVFRSEDPAGVRGHPIFTGNAKVDLYGVEFRDLGRTLNTSISADSTLNPDGTVNSQAANVRGRYCGPHLHHIEREADATIGGYVFRIRKCSVWNTTGNPTQRWGMSVHNTSDGLIEDCVVWNQAGWGIGTEDGPARRNIVRGCFVGRVIGTRSRGDEDFFADFGRESNGIWFANPDNRCLNNVVCNVDRFAYVYYAGVYPGNSVTEAVPVLEFDNNESYGNDIGWVTWYVGTDGGSANPISIGQSIIDNFLCWHCRLTTYPYPHSNHLFRGWRCYGRWDLIQYANINNLGWGYNDYMHNGDTWEDCHFHGFSAGIITPPKAGSSGFSGSEFADVEIVDCDFACWHNILIFTPWGIVGGGDALPRRRHLIDNCTFKTTIGAITRDNGETEEDQTDILMVYNTSGQNGSSGLNWIQDDEVHVTDYNGTPGDDYQCYYAQQVGSHVLPQSGTYDGFFCRGSPSSGKTNTQNLADHGVCLAGEILPGGATDKSKFGCKVEAV